MTSESNHRATWVTRASRSARALRLPAVLPAVSAGVVAAAMMTAAPAHADTVGDSFLNALTNAGVGYTDPANTVALGQSICPMLAQPGGNFASAASSVTGNGMSPQIAGLFTSIAISMFCPAMVSQIASGNFSQIPGLGGQIPGLGGQIPGLGGQIPGLPGI